MAKNKKILIECDFADRVRELLKDISTQLSDGYWEGEENFHDEYWNCFDFEESRPKVRERFELVVRDLPVHDNYRGWSEDFLKMTDERVCDYVKDIAVDILDDYEYVFEFKYSTNVLRVLRDSIKKWKIVPPPLPKLTHEELVEIVGHDFEYVEGTK
jgi:hypothetical protein